VITSFGQVHLFSSDGTHVSDLHQLPGASIGSQLEAGDFNGDGREDLAVGSSFPPSDARVYIYTDVLGLPYSQFEAPAGYDLDNLAFPFAMASGDAHGDGTDELWVGAFGYPEGGRVFRFSGAGVLQQTLISPITNPTFGSDVGVGDIDGDGQDEVAVSMIDTGAPDPSHSGHVHLSDTAGNLVAQIDEEDALPDPSATTFFSQNLAIGDVTGDGKDDILAEAPHGGAFFVFAMDDDFVPETPGPVGGSVALTTKPHSTSIHLPFGPAIAVATGLFVTLATLRLTRRLRP
jgi:hypothetical protein